jgi:glycosyltransferase involved in cell wall biosynthesis
MENKIPKVAVVICNKNYGHFIKDAIQSAILQDYPNRVFYIVDDLSEDNSLEIIHTLCGEGRIIDSTEEFKLERLEKFNDQAIYLFKLNKSGGPSRARNFAIKHAIENGTNLISILDADDIFKQSKLSKSVMKFIEDPELAGVYSDYLHLNTETGAISYESKWAYDLNKLRQECIVHSGAVLNVNWLKQVGLYDEGMRTCEDFHLFRRLAQRGLFVHIPEDLVIVRIQPQNSTQTVSKEIWQQNYQEAMHIQL